MRRTLLLTLCSTLAVAAPPKPVVALLPPSAPDDDLRGFGLMLSARASELIEASGRFSELHLKQVLGMASGEGLDASRLSEDANARSARVLLGADRVVSLSLSSDPRGLTLKGAILDAKRSTPFSVKLPVTWPEALTQGSDAVAKAVLATEKAALPKKTVAQPESRSPEALRALARCYAIVIRQPLGVDTPAVLNGEELDGASARCEEALEHDPSLTFAKAVLALSRAITGDAEGAATALTGFTDADEAVEPYTLARFWMVTRFQSNEDGIASLKQVLNKQPSELIALNYLADTQGVLGDHTASEASWRKYLELSPASPYAWARLSKALARQGRHDDAIAAAKKGLELATNSRTARLELGSRFIDASRFDEAVTTLKALEQPTAEALGRLGFAHWLKGEVDVAAGLFQRSLDAATSPGEWRTRGRAHYNLAMVAAKRGKAEEARAALQASMATGYKVRVVDPVLDQTVKDLVKADLKRADAGSAKVSLLPKESSLLPFDPAGEPDLTRKKDAPPKGFVIYKF